jgi:hypothetical protein
MQQNPVSFVRQLSIEGATSEMSDENAAAEMREALARVRPYAGLREWREDRQRGELGVGEDFASAMMRQFGEEFRSMRSRERGDDPPDLEAVDSQNRRIAIEVTEIVDSAAIRHAGRNPIYRHADWDEAKLADYVGAALMRKGTIELKGGPYHELILVMFTGEYLLDFDRVSHWLSDSCFHRPTQISRAYVSLDYTPGHEYPLVPILWH